MRRVLALVGVLSTLSPGLLAAQCLEYGPVSLPGKLIRQTFPGPPDYRSLARGDEAEIIWVLLLDGFVCAFDPDSRYPSERNEKEIQLVLERDQYQQYSDLLVKRVVVSGELLHGGATHHKRLLLGVGEIERVSLRP